MSAEISTFLICKIIFMCYQFACNHMCVLCTCMCPQRLEEGIKSSGTTVKGCCGPPCWNWELNMDSL